MEMEERLIIGITMGDPASIGPEITVKALSLEEIYHKCRPLVIGDANVMEAAVRIVGKDGIKIHPVHSVDEALFEPGTIDVYDMGLVDMDQLERGKVSAMAGEAAFRYVEKVIQMKDDLRKLISVYEYKDALQAFADARSGAAIKAVIQFS